MGPVERSVATLRIFGDDLDPDNITKLLGSPPTKAHRKGEVLTGKDGQSRSAKTGAWRLEAQDKEPCALNEQVHELLSKLSIDPKVWAELKSRYEMDLFCGLFLGDGNQGESLSPDTLSALGKRGITLGLDIYGP